MSVVSFGASNINVGNQGGLGGTTQLSNLWGGTSNISFDTIWTGKVFSRKTRPGNFGYFASKKFRTIQVYSNNTAKGAATISYPTSISGDGSGINYAFDYSVYSYVTLTAVPTYPYTFAYWQTRTPTSGTTITSSTSVNITATDWTGYLTVTAVFV